MLVEPQFGLLLHWWCLALVSSSRLLSFLSFLGFKDPTWFLSFFLYFIHQNLRLKKWHSNNAIVLLRRVFRSADSRSATPIMQVFRGWRVIPCCWQRSAHADSLIRTHFLTSDTHNNTKCAIPPYFWRQNTPPARDPSHDRPYPIMMQKYGRASPAEMPFGSWYLSGTNYFTPIILIFRKWIMKNKISHRRMLCGVITWSIWSPAHRLYICTE